MRLRQSPLHGLRTAHSTPALVAVVSCAVIQVACRRDRAAPFEATSPSASVSGAPASAPPPSAVAPSGDRKAWCAGAWTGTYRASAIHIELPTSRGGIPEWKADDGKAFTGAGTIELKCADDGTVTGSAHGALGEHEIRGDTGDESLHARLVPTSTAKPPAFSGTLTLTHTDGAVTGDLRASTPDGHVARSAAVTMSRSGE